MPKGGRGRGRAKGKGRAQLLTDSESLRQARRPDVSIQADLPQTGAAPCIHLRSESISSSEQEACEEEKGARRVSSDKEVATEKKLGLFCEISFNLIGPYVHVCILQLYQLFFF